MRNNVLTLIEITGKPAAQPVIDAVQLSFMRRNNFRSLTLSGATRKLVRSPDIVLFVQTRIQNQTLREFSSAAGITFFLQQFGCLLTAERAMQYLKLISTAQEINRDFDPSKLAFQNYQEIFRTESASAMGNSLFSFREIEMLFNIRPRMKDFSDEGFARLANGISQDLRTFLSSDSVFSIK